VDEWLELAEGILELEDVQVVVVVGLGLDLGLLCDLPRLGDGE